MTTVAYRDGVLVSDSQATINGSRISQGVVQKLVKPPKGKSWKLLGKEIVCAGFAGQSSAIPWANKWLEEGVELLPPTGPKIAMISTLCLSADGEVFHWQYNITEKDQHPKHSVIAITGPAAIGSGGVFAESVMSIGASAEKAVKAAIKLDPFSGGDLQYFYLATLSERPPEKEATKP